MNDFDSGPVRTRRPEPPRRHLLMSVRRVTSRGIQSSHTVWYPTTWRGNAGVAETWKGYR